MEISEAYADGKVAFEELDAAFTTADRTHSHPTRPGGLWTWDALDAARLAAHPEMRGLADGTATAAAAAAAAGSGGDYWTRYAAEKARQCELLRDIFCPFRPVAVQAIWLTPTVTDLAHTIYDEGAFDRMPILADALGEAGCDGRHVLEHCRGPGPHVRGCFVVDLVTGRR